MCIWCWRDYGAPTNLPEGWEEIVAMIDRLYAMPEYSLGGPLHVQLEDFNIDVEWKPFDGKVPGLEAYRPEALELAQQICDRMEPLSLEQRAAVLGWREGFFGAYDVTRGEGDPCG